MSIVQQSNSRRAPMPPLPFEPSNLDWHIDDITRLELNNQIIQAVRQRQRDFYEKYQLGLKYQTFNYFPTLFYAIVEFFI